MSNIKRNEIPEKGLESLQIEQRSLQAKLIKKSVPASDKHAPAPSHDSKN